MTIETDIAALITSLGDKSINGLAVRDAFDLIIAYIKASREPDIILQDQKSSGTSAGSASAGVNTRVLNTEVSDLYSECSLSANQFTLAANDYYAEFDTAAHRVNNNQSYIYNVTGTATLVKGRNAWTGSGNDYASTYASGAGFFTVAASQALELRHYCETAHATIGLGIGVASGLTNIYSDVRLWRL